MLPPAGQTHLFHAMPRRLALAGVLLLLAEPAWAQCPDGSPPPCAPAPRAATPPSPALRARQFVLLSFRNVTRRPEHEWLVTGAPLMLGQILGQFSDIGVVPEERLTSARRKLGIGSDAGADAAELRRLAAETGGWTSVTGNVFATGDRLRLTAQSLDAATATVLVRAETEIAANADVREAFDLLSVRLLEPIGIPPGASLASITTRSVDAFRAYVRGQELYQRSRFREAEAEFTTAVRLDSTFAVAWAAIAASAASGGGLEVLLNPTSRAYQAIERAARLSNRLPRRDARLVRAIQALFRGEVRRARQQLDSLLAMNPEDLDAAFWLANMQVMALSVDTSVNPPRLASSVHRAVVLAEMILDRDPRRRSTYMVPVLVYALGAGLWWGDVYGHRREFPSFAAALMMAPEVREVPVLRADTLELVPRSVFDSLPQEEQQRLRRRSADMAWHWAERWLQAGPEDGEAHLWASHAAELRGDYNRALLEVGVADSLGIQSALENKEGRRLSLLLLSGRLATAGAVADSLLGAGTLTARPFVRVFDRRRGYGAAALMLTKRWERVATMAEAMGRPSPSDPPCASLRREMTGYEFAAPPPSVRRAVMDSVNANMQAVMAVPALLPCSDDLAKRLYP